MEGLLDHRLLRCCDGLARGETVIINPIVCLIHNLKLNRWHPVYFRESPAPSDDGTGISVRYKSGGHHTEGFPTREDAIESAKDIAVRLEPSSFGPVRLCLDNDFPWDGEDVPAMVVWFTREGEAQPLF